MTKPGCTNGKSGKNVVQWLVLLMVAQACMGIALVQAQLVDPILSVQPPLQLFDKLGERPNSAALGDINGDGVTDIVTANSGSDDVTVLAGDGGGEFVPVAGSPFAVGRRPVSVALGDVNGDDALDIVTTNEFSGNVTVLASDGAGGFAPVASSPFAVGNGPVSVALGDINGDGTLDIVTANRQSGDVTVLAGDGSGGFAVVAGSPFAVGNGPVSVVLGDINGDGALDIGTSNNSSDDITVLAGDGTGGFVPVAGSPFAVGNSPQSLAMDDVNGDGPLDIVTANFFGSVTVLAGDGSGGFAAVGGSPFAVGGILQSVALADINGDGAPDIFTTNVRNSLGEVRVLAGDGGGGFTVLAGSPFAVGNGPESVVLGDVNDDGATDIVTPNSGSNDVTVLVGDGGGGFMELADSPIVFATDPTDIGLGDIDSDGILDAVILREARDDVVLLRGLGKGIFSRPGAPIKVGDSPESVALGDINGDGGLDIVTANRISNDVTVLAGDGGGAFSAVAGSPFAVGSFPFPVSVALGDINGDGALDIVTANEESGDVTVLAGDGGGGFAPVAGSPFAVGANFPFPQSVELGDVNGDGALDIVTANLFSEDAAVLAGDGLGGFAPVGESPFAVGGQPVSVALGDVNGDGALDIVTANGSGSNDVTVLAGDGNGGFAAVADSPFAVDGRPRSVALRDINDDGALDIATVNDFPDSNLTVLGGDGGGGFAAVVGSPFAVPDGAIALATGLIDGDSLPDVLVVSDGTDEMLTSLTTAPVVDLAIDKTSGSFFMPPGGTITYTILVDNFGPDDAIGARVLDTPPVRLGGLTWTCTPQGGATCNASGTGAIDELVDIPGGDSVTFVMEATLQDMDEVPLSNTTSVTAPASASEFDVGNNQDSDTDLVGLFANGFESIEPD